MTADRCDNSWSLELCSTSVGMGLIPNDCSFIELLLGDWALNCALIEGWVLFFRSKKDAFCYWLFSFGK